MPTVRSVRRTPFQALVPLDLVAHATAHAGHRGETVDERNPAPPKGWWKNVERITNELVRDFATIHSISSNIDDLDLQATIRLGRNRDRS
mgnify:CR=1 FL=1